MQYREKERERGKRETERGREIRRMTEIQEEFREAQNIRRDLYQADQIFIRLSSFPKLSDG